MSNSRIAFLCGVPTLECLGSSIGSAMNSRLKHRVSKVHNSTKEAFNCYKKHLIRQGYTQVGPREFKPNDGGPIRVLTKKSRFGSSLRWGGRGGDLKPRWQPRKRSGGTIIST